MESRSAPHLRLVTPAEARAVFDGVAERLRALGFMADVRTFNIEAGRTQYTIAVYVGIMDPRLDWTSYGSRFVPRGIRYRREWRHGGEFTLFSGADAALLEEFFGQLTMAPAHLARGPYDHQLGQDEWNPYELSDADRATVELHMERAAHLGTIPMASCVSRKRRRAPLRM